MGSTGKLDMVVFLMVVGVAALQLQTSTAQTTHVVLDSLGWIVPTSGGAGAYTAWASSKNFTVGDTLVFNFTTNQHTVAEVTKAAFDACTTTGTLSLWTTGPARVTLNSSGDHSYICTIPSHCSLGQKLTINVTAAAPTPPPAPTPSPAATPPPAAAPSPTPTPPPSPTPSPTTTPPPSPTPSPTTTPPPSPSPSPTTTPPPAPSPSPSATPPPAPSSNATPPAPGSEGTPSTPPAAGSTTPPPAGGTTPPNSATTFAAAALPVTFLSVVVALFY